MKRLMNTRDILLDAVGMS